MTITGTSRFVSRRDAANYYGHGTDIEGKIQSGEIVIGPPPLKTGEKLLIKTEKSAPWLSRRYVIESNVIDDESPPRQKP